MDTYTISYFKGPNLGGLKLTLILLGPNQSISSGSCSIWSWKFVSLCWELRRWMTTCQVGEAATWVAKMRLLQVCHKVRPISWTKSVEVWPMSEDILPTWNSRNVLAPSARWNCQNCKLPSLVSDALWTGEITEHPAGLDLQAGNLLVLGRSQDYSVKELIWVLIG